MNTAMAEDARPHEVKQNRFWKKSIATMTLLTLLTFSVTGCMGGRTRIGVTVRDESSSYPISGARVTLDYHVKDKSMTEKQKLSGATNVKGFFYVSVPRVFLPRRLYVTVEKQGYETHKIHIGGYEDRTLREIRFSASLKPKIPETKKK